MQIIVRFFLPKRKTSHIILGFLLELLKDHEKWFDFYHLEVWDLKWKTFLTE